MAKFIYEGRLVEGTLLDEQDEKTYTELLDDLEHLSTNFISSGQRKDVAEMLLTKYDITKKCAPESEE